MTDGRIGDRTGLAAGLALTAIGCAAVLIPGIAGLVARRRSDRHRGRCHHPDRIRPPRCHHPDRTARTNTGCSRSRPRTRRRRRPIAGRRARRRHHAHPRAADIRRPPDHHRRHRRRTHQAPAASNPRRFERLTAPWISCRQRDYGKEQHDDRGPIAGRVRRSATRPGALRLPRGRRICAAGRLRRPAARGDHPDRGGHLRRFGTHEHRRRVSSSRSSPPSSATTSVSSWAISADARWCTASAATSS